MKLYELPAAFAEIESLAIDGELPPEAWERLASLELALPAKLDGCCRVMRHFEAQQAAYKAEADRFGQHAKIAESNAKRLKTYMQGALEAMNLDKVETSLFKLRLQKNPPSCQWDETLDPAALPDAFKVVTVEPSKRAALAAAKDGQTLPAGFTVIQTRSLRIS